MVRRRLSLPFTDVKEDDKVVADEEINNWKWKSYHEQYPHHQQYRQYTISTVPQKSKGTSYCSLNSKSLHYSHQS